MEKYTITKFDGYGREPVIRRLPDGALCSYFLTGGVLEPANDNYVDFAYSYDDGKTWSERKKTFAHDERACWCGELCTFSDRPWVAVQTYSAQYVYNELQTYRSYYLGNETWSEPTAVKGVKGVCVRHGIKMSDGEFLFPVYWQEIRRGFNEYIDEKSTVDSKFISGCIVSADDEYYTLHGYLALDDSDVLEPTCIEKENGHILMYARTRKEYLAFSESFDYGRTWSKLTLSDIPNPDAKPHLEKIDGEIYLINNFTTGANWVDENGNINFDGIGKRRKKNLRTHFGIAKLEDGKVGEILFIEDENEKWFYPATMVDDDAKMLYLAYENKKEHRLAKIPFSELKNISRK